MFDNTRYLTFKVGDARRILTISDREQDAAFWQIAHIAKREFGCLVVTPDKLSVVDGQTKVEVVPDPKKPNETASLNIREFEAVCLLDVADPSAKGNSLDSLWDKLRPYVESGGKLVVIPGEHLSKEGYAAGGNLMPGAVQGNPRHQDDAAASSAADGAGLVRPARGNQRRDVGPHRLGHPASHASRLPGVESQGERGCGQEPSARPEILGRRQVGRVQRGRLLPRRRRPRQASSGRAGKEHTGPQGPQEDVAAAS